LLKAKPVADNSTINGRLARRAGQSRFKCGQANGSRMRKTPIHLMQDKVNGGTWPAT
jgi:hypothetical protein